MKRLTILPVFLLLIVGTVSAQNRISFPSLRYYECADEYDELQEALEGNSSTTVNKAEQTYETCHFEQFDFFNELTRQGNEYIQEENYERALQSFLQARDLVIDTSSVDAVLIDLSIALADQAYQKGDYTEMDKRLTYAQSLGRLEKRDQYLTRYLYALVEVQQRDREDARDTGKKARQYAETRVEIEQIGSLMAYINEQLLAPSSDQLSYRQFWLSKLKIDDVRTKLPKDPKKDVVIAIIDSAIDVYHPDMQGQIWTNEDEIPDNGKDDDGNGFIDDIHGVNLLDNTGGITVTDGHGTLVGGVVGALGNNDLGISGIVPHVQLMSIVVCKEDTCLPGSKLAEAIRYAVDNGADIINMSLSSTAGSKTTNTLAQAIAYANLHNVIIVTSAGNGLENGDGTKSAINTDEVAISPVCSESNPKQIIGVGAANQRSEVIPRSNTGKCVDVIAYGEGIISTAFFGTTTGSYGIAEGTSLAAPMVAGIIGLGHLMYGEQHREIVYDSLIASLNKNNIPEADKYLQELDKRRLSTKRKEDIEKVALLIYQLVQKTSLPDQLSQIQQLRKLLDTYATKLEKERAYTKLSTLYYLEQALKNYSLFETL